MSYPNEFIHAFGDLLQKELGFVDDPDDRGGRTIYGISERSHPDAWKDDKIPTLDDAAEIYWTDYWEALGLGKIKEQLVREEIFDTAVIMGPERATRIAQEALRDLGEEARVDGKMGPITRGVLNGYRDQEVLVVALNATQYRHFVQMNRPKYIRGWIKKRVRL